MNILEITAIIATSNAVLTSVVGAVLYFKMKKTHDLVNGQSEKLNKAVAKGSFAEGKEAGISQEQAKNA